MEKNKKKDNTIRLYGPENHVKFNFTLTKTDRIAYKQWSDDLIARELSKKVIEQCHQTRQCANCNTNGCQTFDELLAQETARINKQFSFCSNFYNSWGSFNVSVLFKPFHKFWKLLQLVGAAIKRPIFHISCFWKSL